ncbi:MAG: hydrogenase 4 subunit F [Candidatus Levybacteria bacterium]|nr:hydrogenase 4 subunit F [Candidatus Levybacteria bacterium]
MILSLVILVPLAASILSLLVAKRAKNLYRIAAAASFIELAASSAVTYSIAVNNSPFSWTPYFSVDFLGAILLMLVAIVGLATSIYSIGYFKAEVDKKIIGFHRVREYFILLHLFLMAMFFAITTTSPVLMWIAIEATTLSTAFLISFYNKPSAMEAAWKYLIINSIGLLIGFLGTLLFLSIVSHPYPINLIDWSALAKNASNANPLIVKIAFVLVLIGYGTKVGLAPMHTWLPDAHSKAPVPLSSLLSGVLLNVAFLAIIRFKIVTDLSVGANFSQGLLIFFGILSIVIASLIILMQKNYKRLLAYSSIEHMGIIALGFGFGGIGIFAALLHMVYHSLAKSMLFLASGNIFLKYSTTRISSTKGAIFVLPVTGVLFLAGFLAITGIPPFGTFLTEIYIVSAGLKNHPVIVITAIIALTLAFVGFLRSVFSMAYGEPGEITKGEKSKWTTLPLIAIFIILLALSLYLPDFIKVFIQNASALISKTI